MGSDESGKASGDWLTRTKEVSRDLQASSTSKFFKNYYFLKPKSNSLSEKEIFSMELVGEDISSMRWLSRLV